MKESFSTLDRQFILLEKSKMLGMEEKNRKTLAELISLHGKTCLITGSASGIGKAIAYRFAEAGADLQLVDIDDKKLETVRCELSKFGTDVSVFQG